MSVSEGEPIVRRRAWVGVEWVRRRRSRKGDDSSVGWMDGRCGLESERCHCRWVRVAVGRAVGDVVLRCVVVSVLIFVGSGDSSRSALSPNVSRSIAAVVKLCSYTYNHVVLARAIMASPATESTHARLSKRSIRRRKGTENKK